MVIILMAEKNELHQESCFEVAVTGLVCLLKMHQTSCTQNADTEASLGQGCWSQRYISASLDQWYPGTGGLRGFSS